MPVVRAVWVVTAVWMVTVAAGREVGSAVATKAAVVQVAARTSYKKRRPPWLMSQSLLPKEAYIQNSDTHRLRYHEQ